MTATDLAPAAGAPTGGASTTVTAGASAPDTGASALHNPHHTRRWAILAVLATAQLMVVLDTTVVNIALPSAQRRSAFQLATGNGS